MKPGNIFEIERLLCSYSFHKRNKTVEVLEVEDIKIASGEITVILGPSGCGKSTLMEALSLMSDTIDADRSRNIFFYSDKEDSPINLAKIDKDPQYLKDVRFRNFCFIFQDTNIMENFNPVENVAIPRMVNEPFDGKSKEDAEKVLINRLSLNIDLKKKGSSYSGGQKQRFAFARAFLANGDILFGDEPTGNLDKYNSEKLFNVINYYVRLAPDANNDFCKKTGAIIVTHSIDLALQFADTIIVIVKPERINIHASEQSGMGYSNPFFVYRNSGAQAWRIDTTDYESIVLDDLDDSGYLPPINDDGSTRFTYSRENGEPDGSLIKDQLKREIIFYLNNSYAFPQKILVEVARQLGGKLISGPSDENGKADRERLFGIFNEVKHEILDLIDTRSKEKTKIEDFEKSLLTDLRERFSDRREILELIPGSF